MGAEGKGHCFVFFILFKHLLPSPPEEVCVFVLHNVWLLEAKGPEHQWCAGQASPGSLRQHPWVGELQHLITRMSFSVSLGVHRLSRACPRGAQILSPRARRAGRGLGLWDRGVAVPVVDLDVALAPEVGIEDVAVAVIPPPGAKLPVPGAVQHVEELGVLHADHGEEVLVPEVTPEVVLVGQLLHLRRLQQAVVQRGLAHGLQVEQHHPTVEAWEPLGRRAPDPRLWVIMAELPECVPREGEENRFSLMCVWETVCELISLGLNNHPRGSPLSLRFYSHQT